MYTCALPYLPMNHMKMYTHTKKNEDQELHGTSPKTKRCKLGDNPDKAQVPRV